MDQLDPARPPHVGVLLDNVPEYIFWLAGGGPVGERRRRDQLHLPGRPAGPAGGVHRLPGGGHVDVTSGRCSTGWTWGSAEDRIVEVDAPGLTPARCRPRPPTVPAQVGRGGPVPPDLHVRLDGHAQSRALHAGSLCPNRRATWPRSPQLGRGRRRVRAAPVLPLELAVHRLVLVAGHAGVPIAIRSGSRPRGRCPTSAATAPPCMTYTGKVLNYILAVPEQRRRRRAPRSGWPSGTRPPLVTSLSSPVDSAATYGTATGRPKGIIIIRRDPSMPDGALGRAADTVKVIDAETGLECPAADVRRRRSGDEPGRGRRARSSRPRPPAASRVTTGTRTPPRLGSGTGGTGPATSPTGTRDGWFYFAGRSNEWLRVDGENFAAAPVEAIIGRFPGVRSVAVYAVPDDPVGDRVMAAVELRGRRTVRPGRVRSPSSPSSPISARSGSLTSSGSCRELPKLASMKIDKQRLRREAWRSEEVWWRPQKNGPLVPMTDLDRQRLEHLFT